MQSCNRVGPAWHGRRLSSPVRLALLACCPAAVLPHSLSPRVFWRRSCLACSLVMRFLPSRYSFIFYKGGGRERAIRLLKENQKNQMFSCTIPFVRRHLVSDPISTRSIVNFFEAPSNWAAADFHGGSAFLLDALLGAPRWSM